MRSAASSSASRSSGVSCSNACEAVGAVDAPAGRVEVVAVEQPSQFAHRLVTLVADSADDVRDVAGDVIVRLAPGVDQRGEGGLEVFVGGGEADHQKSPPPSGEGLGWGSATGNWLGETDSPHPQPLPKGRG